MLEKFLKKDKNEELEKILEQKDIEEQAKNLLQSMLYKIDVSYKDYKKVTCTEITKDNYIKEILNIVERKCQKIRTINLSSKIEDKYIEQELKKNKFCILDEEIISYPIEEKLLYAIEKKANNKRIVNSKNELISIPLSDLINTGRNISQVEVLRDFNGWSWSTTKSEIENIQANLVFKALTILLGEEYLESWSQDKDGIIDYYDIMKETFQKKYGEILTESFVESLTKMSIINEDLDEQNKKEILEELEKNENEIEKYNDTQKNLTEIYEHKKEATKQLKKIEQILSQESKIKQEYERRNKDVDLHKKIFSIKVLKQQLNDEKNILLNKIEEDTYYLNPINYVKEKGTIIRKKELLETIKYNENKKEELIINFIKVFLNCFDEEISKKTENENIIKMIYKFRYFVTLPFNKNKNIKDVKEIDKDIEKVERKLVKTAIEKKVIANIPFEVMKHIFETRIISLEELYYKIENKNEKYYVQIFDENISEEEFEIKPVEKTKINKKIKIFI